MGAYPIIPTETHSVTFCDLVALIKKLVLKFILSAPETTPPSAVRGARWSYRGPYARAQDAARRERTQRRAEHQQRARLAAPAVKPLVTMIL